MSGVRTIAAVCAAAIISGFASDAARLQLEYVVIVTRHGVRAPTWEMERLNRYSSEPWPMWGVPPGHLTTRGRMLMGLMGSYYGAWLSSEGLLPRTGCEDAARIYIWADTDQRTIETGRALAETLLPGCTIPVHAQAGGGDDPLFDPIAAGLVEPDLTIAAQAVRDRLGSEPQRVLQLHRRNFEMLQDILTGGAPAPKKAFESLADISVTTEDKAVALNGPLSVASTLTENFLLEYANGFQGSDLGWGRLNADNLARVLELHGTYADLMRRTPYLARARSSNLLAHVLRSLRQAETGHAVSGALGRTGDAVLILSGHDTNLSNLSGMLGLRWQLPGYQADETPPGGALVFSLWRDTASGTDVVRTEYLAQTLDQMRNADILTLARPPARQEVAIPGCRAQGTNTDCRWDAFAHAVEQAIDPAFVR